jgi:hypothetical protein
VRESNKIYFVYSMTKVKKAQISPSRQRQVEFLQESPENPFRAHDSDSEESQPTVSPKVSLQRNYNVCYSRFCTFMGLTDGLGHNRTRQSTTIRTCSTSWHGILKQTPIEGANLADMEPRSNAFFRREASPQMFNGLKLVPTRSQRRSIHSKTVCQGYLRNK